MNDGAILANSGHFDILFTSESVSEGHPDKVCDQISDAIARRDLRPGPRLARRLRDDGLARLRGVAGEFTTKAQVDYQEVVRGVIKDIGYDDAEMGFDYNSCAVLTSIQRQSRGHRARCRRGDLAEQGAGRRRPGHDVRLRLHGDGRADAVPDPLQPPDPRGAGAGAQERPLQVPPPRREEPVDGRVRREQQAGPGRHVVISTSTTPRSRPRSCTRR
jgi:hypothetical protein